MNKTTHEILGWYWVIAVIWAYASLSFWIIESNSLYYQLLNLTWAIWIWVDAYYDGNTQPVVLNIVWWVIAIVSLGKIYI